MVEPTQDDGRKVNVKLILLGLLAAILVLFGLLNTDEVEVKAQAKEGFAVAEDGAYVAALVTDLTPELVAEGLSREFVRRVQDLRKSAELDVAEFAHARNTDEIIADARK